MNNNTKARFDAERVEAGYKYLDSLRELMGVGQPVGEGGAPELLPCPFCGAAGSVYLHGEDYAGSPQVDVGCSGGCEITPRACGDVSPDAEQDEKWAIEVWNTRATQLATAPNVSAALGDLFDLLEKDQSGRWCFKSLSRDGGKWNEVIERLSTVAAPANVAERARRAVYALGPMIELADLSDAEIERAVDIIAAEFGGGSSRST